MAIPTVTLTNATPQLMPTPKPETALAKSNAAAADKIITSTDVFKDRLATWQAQHYNVLTPTVELTGLAVQHGLIASKVQLDVTEESGDVYGKMPWLKAGELAIAKNGLRKIASAAGISTTCLRMDDRRIPNYWEFKCVASWRDIDGSVIVREATKDWDARDGADLLKGFTPAQIQQARRNGLRHCESRATNAAIREYGVKQKYTREELAKPFVVVRVMYLPDHSDPATRQAMTEAFLRGTSALYTHTSPAALGAAPRVIDVDPEDETPAGPADPNQPPTPGAVRIVKVEAKSGETNGRKWTCHTVVDSNGVEYTTFSNTVATAAVKFRDARAWVDISDEQNGEYHNIIEIGPAQPSLLPDPGNL
jgi:hypothetical protein